MNIELSELWNKCLRDIELEVSKPNFSTWFKHTIILREEAGTICIGVPNEFVRDWLSNKYQKLILKSLVQHMDQVRGIEFNITRAGDRIKQQEEVAKGTAFRPSRELPLQDLYINKDDNLNPRYTFDSFVVGPFNELAHAATQAIIARPGIVSYNPLFVYGASGIGKTHLLQAAGNAIKAKHPEKKIHYTSLEKFSIDYINSVQNNKGNSFKEKYRKYDVIIMDDIQFITGKEKTQEELFHLFNTMYESNKQIIFSSDKHPNFIVGLEDRMRSRLSQGMAIDINEPDYESRVAILKSKSKELNLSLSDEIFSYIADLFQGNVRELEGCVNTLLCQSQMKNHTLTVNEVKNLLKNNIRPKKNTSTKEVVKVVAQYYNIEEDSIYEKTRRKEIVKARQMIMYILREEFNVSYSLIGQKLGGKDHTTVIHSYEKIKNDLKHDPLLVQEFEALKVMFK